MSAALKVLGARRRLTSGRVSVSTGLITSIMLVVLMELVAMLRGEDAFAVLITGLAFGSLYALIALGYTMVYGIIELINFAHGDVFAFGAFVSLTVMEHLSNGMVQYGSFIGGTNTIDFLGLTIRLDIFWLSILTLAISILVAALICGILGVIIERVAYRRLRNAPRLAPLITAIGVSLILENAIFQWRGGVPVAFPTVMLQKNVDSVGPVHFGFGSDLQNIQIIVIAAAVVFMLVVDAFINRTKLGKAMRAVAQDREAALMMGINVDRIIALTFFVGSALAGAGAVIYGIQITTVTSNMGFSLGLFAFTAAVLGGIGNIRGAMLGGLLIGLIERFVDSLGNGAGTEWSTPVIFAVLILILIFRPSGLLGSQVPEKV